jgi:hypothetical protein
MRHVRLRVPHTDSGEVLDGEQGMGKLMCGEGGRERAPGTGIDDHPYPVRLGSQRFGSALVPTGNLQLKKKQYAKDFGPIDPECTCPTCRK